MKLVSIHVLYNRYNFENEGIAPESYGGRAVFATDVGDVVIKLDQNDVSEMLEVVSPKVAQSLSYIANSASPSAVAGSTRLPLSAPVQPPVNPIPF